MNERINELCRRASVEYDAAKLLELIKEINHQMREEESKKNGNGTLRPALEPRESL